MRIFQVAPTSGIRPVWPVLILATTYNNALDCARKNGIGVASFRHLTDPHDLAGLDSPTVWIANDVWNEQNWIEMSHRLLRCGAVVMLATEGARGFYRRDCIENIFGFRRGFNNLIKRDNDQYRLAP